MMKIYYFGRAPHLCAWTHMWSTADPYTPMLLYAWVHLAAIKVLFPYLALLFSILHLMYYQIVPLCNLGHALRAGCPNLLITRTTSCSQSHKLKSRTKRLSQIYEPCQTFFGHLLLLQVSIWALFLCHRDCQQSLIYNTLQQCWLDGFLWHFELAYQWMFARCLVQLMNYPRLELLLFSLFDLICFCSVKGSSYLISIQVLHLLTWLLI